jgi:hypothetical protein
MLEEFLIFIFEEEGPKGPNNILFQQAGVPLHVNITVWHFFGRNCSQKWVGRCSIITWPPLSPDLIPLDFFFWGYMKNVVYISPMSTT